MPSGRVSTAFLDQVKDDINALDNEDVSIMKGVAQRGSITDAELAAHLLVLPSAIDKGIDHLQALGYVEATDTTQPKHQVGRRVIKLSPKGIKAYKLLSLFDE